MDNLIFDQNKQITRTMNNLIFDQNKQTTNYLLNEILKINLINSLDIKTRFKNGLNIFPQNDLRAPYFSQCAKYLTDISNIIRLPLSTIDLSKGIIRFDIPPLLVNQCFIVMDYQNDVLSFNTVSATLNERLIFKSCLAGTISITFLNAEVSYDFVATNSNYTNNIFRIFNTIDLRLIDYVPNVNFNISASSTYIDIVILTINPIYLDL